MARIKKGDTVEVRSGEHRGERGVVHTVLPKKERVVVSGVNIVKRHQRPTGRVRTQAGIIEFEAPLHLSKVMLVCPHCNQTTRVAHRFEEGRRVRACQKCGRTIEKK